MIPRTTRRLTERTLVPYSRQALPRHVRYSTPSKRVQAEALPAGAVPHPDYHSFMPFTPTSTPKPDPEEGSMTAEMHNFLKLRSPYTIIPTPSPAKEHSEIHDFYFTDTPTQDHLSIMDACLHSCYDVPRAKQVLERMRDARAPGDPVLDSRLYNGFLAAYLQMATNKEPEKRQYWLEEMWALYDAMESGADKVPPTSTTYALMLLSWNRFHPESATPVPEVTMTPPHQLLQPIVDRNISASLVVSDRNIASTEEATEIMTMLSRAAVEMNLSSIVSELGQAEAHGSTSDVPEAKPVLKAKVQPVEYDEEGKVIPAAADAPVEYEVPFNLENLRKHLAHVAYARRVLPEDTYARQKLLEESVYDIAAARFKHEAEAFEEMGLADEQKLRSAPLRKWMFEWHQKLEERLKRDIEQLAVHEARPRTGRGNFRAEEDQVKLSPFLSLLKSNTLSLITIFEVMHLSGSGGVNDGMKTARALIEVGRAVELEYKAEMCRKNKIQFPVGMANGRADAGSFFTTLGYRDLHQRRVTAAQYIQDAEEWTSQWSQVLKARVGSFLLDALMDVATVQRTAVSKKTGEELTEEQPAFQHGYEYMKGHKLGVIKLNPAVAERIAKDSVRETFHPRHLPMLVPPKPWLSHDQGGYLYNKTQAMRFKESKEQQVYLAHASQQGHVELVYAGLDVLGSTPWEINREVFDTILKVWNSGDRFCKIPPAQFDQPEPELIQGMEEDPAKRSVYLQRQKHWIQGKANNHSERCGVNYRIEIARAFLGDKIYFPHNIDFRGRAYPVPPHLSHIGDDLSRSILKFAEKRPLGERGLRWLKIHLANLYGFDKASFDERVNFVHEHLDDVYDSATQPLEGRRWWTKADDPWQCLATCMELRAALESGDPQAFESGLPVHQDGTCNGLQHYAALGGDATGAAQVNLAVTDRPSDVYTFVANMVEAAMRKDIEQDDNRYAKMLEGKIARKVVKQTVMTTVYGVTFIGARDQIEKQLLSRGDIPPEECWAAASYLAKKVLDCIGNLFQGAKDIQNWLNMSARLIAKSIPPQRLDLSTMDGLPGQKRRGRPPKSRKTTGRGIALKQLRKEQMTSVIWTTPLGLPIVQPYRAVKRRQVLTSMQSVYISDPNVPEVVNGNKQATAFPPNFVHSLDATHMMLTALECRSQGLTFASVHDSYWTHASTIDQMSSIIRDTFIALHSSDILAKLREEFMARYKDYKVPLVSLKTGNLLKTLGLTDAAIVAPPSEIKKLEGAPGLLTLTDKEEALVEEENADDVDELVDASAEGVGADTAVESKFVNLTDILPPLPKKGDFNVETIKKSLYFFS